eukprot:TRINITY_DN77738_c0_g1_i1.p1 TRINITY_DN77738_c0_g1~~TRINITY_DN77738_c0_g1_i1.p1  ORF type:complete len:121 (-),score=8.53 TRINITY_DN77738_c0_g1_i1:101-463(-)
MAKAQNCTNLMIPNIQLAAYKWASKGKPPTVNSQWQKFIHQINRSVQSMQITVSTKKIKKGINAMFGLTPINSATTFWIKRGIFFVNIRGQLNGKNRLIVYIQWKTFVYWTTRISNQHKI